MNITPEVQAFSDRLMYRYPILRQPAKEFFVKAMRESMEFNGCFFSYWRVMDYNNIARYLIISRNDRKPNFDEAMPFLQTLFEDGNRDILEVSNSPYTLEFVQSKNIYETQSMAEQMGDGLADYADKKDEVEEFDFDKTSTAKRMTDAIDSNSSR